jgi:hypothetical protein
MNYEVKILYMYISLKANWIRSLQIYIYGIEMSCGILGKNKIGFACNQSLGNLGFKVLNSRFFNYIL